MTKVMLFKTSLRMPTILSRWLTYYTITNKLAYFKKLLAQSLKILNNALKITTIPEFLLLLLEEPLIKHRIYLYIMNYDNNIRSHKE